MYSYLSIIQITAYLLISFNLSLALLFPGSIYQNRHRRYSKSQHMMGWSETWQDILSGGNPRWKVTSKICHEKALAHFQQHVKGDPSETSVLCPLAGDDEFVYLLFSKGYTVTTIDLVPAAVEAMKEQFGSCTWTKDETTDCGSVIWRHENGRANLIVGDALQKRPYLNNKFDAVYDKDSFGALDKQNRSPFCQRIAEFTKSGAIVYLECKLRDNHDENKDVGPPYSLKEEDLINHNNYGEHFNYVEGLGSIYDISMPMKQTGHILQRK